MSLFKSLVRPKPAKPVRRREIFDLSVLRANRVYYFAGNNLSVEDLTAGAVVTLRFDDPDAVLRLLVIHNSYQLLPFNRIYLTNAVQPGLSLTIEFDFYGFNSEEQAMESLQALNELINDVKLNTLKLLDAGTLIYGNAVLLNAAAVLYTVPAGRVFYLLGFDFNVYPVAIAVAVSASIYYNDGANRVVSVLESTAPAPEMWHTVNSYTGFKMLAGWTINAISSDVNSNVHATIVGIEV